MRPLTGIRAWNRAQCSYTLNWTHHKHKSTGRTRGRGDTSGRQLATWTCTAAAARRGAKREDTPREEKRREAKRKHGSRLDTTREDTTRQASNLTASCPQPAISRTRARAARSLIGHRYSVHASDRRTHCNACASRVIKSSDCKLYSYLRNLAMRGDAMRRERRQRREEQQRGRQTAPVPARGGRSADSHIRLDTAAGWQSACRARAPLAFDIAIYSTSTPTLTRTLTLPARQVLTRSRRAPVTTWRLASGETPSVTRRTRESPTRTRA